MKTENRMIYRSFAGTSEDRRSQPAGKCMHHLNDITKEQEKQQQQKTPDIFLLNNPYDNFFSKLVHKP